MSVREPHASKRIAYEEDIAYGLGGGDRTEPGGVCVPGIPATWGA